MRRLALVAAVVALLAAAAPAASAAAPTARGAADSIPQPAESVAHLVARTRAAVVALWNRDCAAWRSYQLSLRYHQIAACSDAARLRIASAFRIVGAARFGTGAVITYVSAGHPKGFTIAFVLGPGRRWIFDTSLDPVASPGVFRGSPRAAVFHRPLRLFLAGVRTGSCDRVWAYGSWVVPNNSSGKRIACRQAFGPPKAGWVSDLQANPGARPMDFGGTREFRFYGLRTPLHFYTFVVTHYPDAGPPSTHLTDAPPGWAY